MPDNCSVGADRPQGRVDSIVGQITRMIEITNQGTERAREHADYLLGPQSTVGRTGEDPCDPVDLGQLGNLLEGLNVLEGALIRLTDQSARFRAI